ncbi:MAG TPA: Na+/H+ antiporter NhaC family protein [Clostridia bacterium]|nr:Na+/H+ antiporter NhaC family protein [Clostridia bacterium]
MEQQQSGARIGRRAFISAALILLVLMIGAGVLTRLVPAGRYQRSVQDGREVLDPTSFSLTQARPLPVWRWFTAPVEVLGSSDAVMVITIILFILLVGGSFAVLDHTGVIRTIIARIVTRFRSRRFVLIAVICLFFMGMGALLGIFEETVPLIPIVVALAWSMGWDSLTGLGMSLLATGFGFSAAIANPFSIGVAQGIAGLPLFSGAWFRIIVFAVMYVILTTFVVVHARRVEKHSSFDQSWPEEQAARARYRQASDGVTFETPRRAVTWSVCCLGAMLAVVLLGPLVPALQTYSLPLIGLAFVTAGLGAGFMAGLGARDTLRTFLSGLAGMAPGILLILMAMSVKHIVAEAGIMDTILHGAATGISKTSPSVASLLIYAVTLGMNFFIGSASAKAFLMMPLLAPLADLVGLTRQIAVTAFCFGDGFSNLVYPTNAVLLIGLGLTSVSYPRWFRWTIVLQLITLVVTAAFLLLAVSLHFGPF